MPEGQIKIRARIAPDGQVLRTEVLESGFHDDGMEKCLQRLVDEQRWPENESGHVQYVDVIYWVSLGAQGDRSSETFRTQLRKQQLMAGMRAKQCIQGRVSEGSYRVEGLNLVDREGRTLVNRVNRGPLPSSINSCVAQAFSEIRLPRDGSAFVRPVSPQVTFQVDADGVVRVEGEEWLELVLAEERAAREAQRAELTGHGGPSPSRVNGPDGAAQLVDEGPGGDGEPDPVEEAAADADGEAQPDAPAPPPDPAALDPGRGGIKLQLGGQRRDG